MMAIRSKSEELREVILQLILTGRYLPGARLPSEADLGEAYRVSRTTVRVALAGLVRDGHLRTRRGARPVVVAVDRPATPAAVRASLVFLLIRERLTNDVMRHIVGAVAERMPQGFGLRIHYDDRPGQLRHGIGPEDLVVVDDALAPLGLPAFPDPARVVRLNRPGGDGGYLSTDNRNGGEQVAGHLLGLGHQSIGILHYGTREKDFSRRLTGCRDRLLQAGATLEEVALNLLDDTEITVEQSVEPLFRRRPGLTAIICMMDLLALQVYTVLDKMGLRVPHDIPVVGFDNIEAAGWVDPPLTSVSHPAEDMARELVRSLAQGAPAPRALLRPTLIVRGSTAPARTRAMEPP
jgi:DNA-binding transcriptional regulator YhcF (GntR family)